MRIIAFLCVAFFVCSCKNITSEPNFNKTSKFSDLNNWPLRGVTIVTHDNIQEINNETIALLKSYGINFIRLRISIRKEKFTQGIPVDSVIYNVFSQSKRVINLCKLNDIDVLISHSDFPIQDSLGIRQMDRDFWENKELLKSATVFASNLVKEFDDFENVFGYEFFAEPVIAENNSSIVPPNWNEYFTKLLKSLRKETSKYVVYTPGPWGGPMGYKSMSKPINDEKILYNFHFYQPHKYTHQKIKGKKKEYNYPGIVGFRSINNAFVEDQMRTAVNWAAKHKVPMFVGEFSVNVRAPNRIEYLTDVLNTFEKNKLSYAYFSFNGWKGWSYPFIKSNDSLNRENPTLKLLKSFWNKNKENDN